MTDEGDADSAGKLTGAAEEISRQREEIAWLREKLADQALDEDLEDALAIAAAAGVLGSPLRHAELLRMILEIAATVVSAESAILLLLDQDGDELVFDVTTGLEHDELRGLRLPIGQGIGGLVAASGQPIAASEVEGVMRIEPEVGAALPYAPRSVAAVPLSYNDRVIGVLEVVDQEVRPFSAGDLETLRLFARLAAVAIRQSRTQQEIGTLLREALEASPGRASTEGGDRAVTLRAEADATFRAVRELTELVYRVSRYGENEAHACSALIRSFEEYLRARPRPGGSVGLSE